MADLQAAFYIVSITFMGIILLLGLIMLTVLLLIRAKINAVYHRIEDKLNKVTSWAEKGGAVLGALKKVRVDHKK